MGNILFRGNILHDLGMAADGVDWFLLGAGGKVGILEDESESFLLEAGAKVEISSLNFKFKGEFFENFNWKLEFFAKIWTLRLEFYFSGGVAQHHQLKTKKTVLDYSRIY